MCANRYEVDAPLVAHDEELPAPDELTDLFINHVWRRFVGGLLNHFSQQVDFIGTDPEIEQAQNWYDALVLDFYTPDGGFEMAYHGALVGNQAGFLITTTPTAISFDDTATMPHHDTDGFFNPSFPDFLQVPSGLGGYYRIHGLVQVTTGTIAPYVEFETNGTDILMRNFSALTTPDIIRLDVIAHLVATQVVEFQSWMTSLTRSAVAVGGGHNWAAQFGMYRIGIAP